MAFEDPPGTYLLNVDGAAAYGRLVQQREDDLRQMLADWDRNEQPDVKAMLRGLAASFASSPPAKV